MRIQYQLTEDDLITFMLFDKRNAPKLFPHARNTWLRQTIAGAGAGLILVIILMLLPGREGNPLIPLWPDLALIIALMVLGLLAFPWFKRYTGLDRALASIQVRANITSGRTGNFKPTNLEIAPDGFQLARSGWDTRVLWTEVECTVQDENAIYIYATPAWAYLVPRRAFENADQAQEFFQAVEGYIEAGRSQRAIQSPAV